MHVDHRLAPVEFVEHRPVDGIAQPLVAVVRLQPDAVGFERVEHVFDLFKRGVDVEHRERGEQAEASGIIAHHLAGEVIAGARHAGGPFRTGVEPQAGRRR